MTPTRNARWSYPVTMCLAPRYIRGPIAAPRIDCRNRASLPDTPWARASGTTTIAISATVRSPSLRATLILSMTVVARGVHILAGCHHLVSAFRLCRAQCDRPRIDQRLRHLDPVTLVDRTAANQHQVAGFNQRGAAVADGLPFFVRMGSFLFGACGRHREADRIEHGRGRRTGDPLHDLLHAGDRDDRRG